MDKGLKATTKADVQTSTTARPATCSPQSGCFITIADVKEIVVARKGLTGFVHQLPTAYTIRLKDLKEAMTVGRRRALDGSADIDASPIGRDDRATDAGPVVSVRDLHVTFRRGGRDLHARARRVVRHHAGRDPRPRRRVGRGQERARPEPARPARRAIPRPGSAAARSSAASTWCRRPHEERRLRAQDQLGAVFQDPMTSLNPTMRIGRQVAEAAGIDDRGAAAARRGRHPRAGAAAARVPARAVGRAAPARDDRDGDRRQARRS